MPWKYLRMMFNCSRRAQIVQQAVDEQLYAAERSRHDSEAVLRDSFKRTSAAATLVRGLEKDIQI